MDEKPKTARKAWPWEISTHNGGIVIMTEPKYHPVFGDIRQYFAAGGYGPHEYSDVIAKARMMAAAPEMLAALKDVLSACEAACHALGRGLGGEYPIRRMEKARAAIAKAEGAQS